MPVPHSVENPQSSWAAEGTQFFAISGPNCKAMESTFQNTRKGKFVSAAVSKNSVRTD